jgi:hypothetical protein
VSIISKIQKIESGIQNILINSPTFKSVPRIEVTSTSSLIMQLQFDQQKGDIMLTKSDTIRFSQIRDLFTPDYTTLHALQSL